MKIGSVSKKLGIPASTIRYYERKGLIKRQTRVSGIREFDGKSITTLRFVQIAQQAGFTINEMKTLLKSYDNDPNASGMWTSLAREKQKSVQNQMRSMQGMEKILEKLLECKCKTLHECVSAAFEPSEQNPVSENG